MEKQNFIDLPLEWGWRIKRTGKSQEEFAAYSGVNFNTLASIIHNKKRKPNPTLETVEKVESALWKLEQAGEQQGNG